MIVIGLTGSIAMGKSVVTAQCALLGAKTISADAIVHRLLQPDGAAYQPVIDAFPSVVKSGIINRSTLGSIVFADETKLKILERILHPLVIGEEEKFVRQQKHLGAKMVVLDIPLLFETGGEARMDMVLVASAPYIIQRQRVLARSGMTGEKFNAILAKQMPDRQKRAYADMVIHTGLGKAHSMRQLKELFTQLKVVL